MSMLRLMAREDRYTVEVPLAELTDRQILIDLYKRQVSTLKKVEKYMADLSKSVEDLQTAVDDINARFAGKVQELQSALDEAKDALAAEELDDAELQQRLQDALDNASNAADQINSQIDELNQIGADPSTPVEPDTGGDTGTDDSGTGTDPNAPHPDQTLPGDLPPNPDDQPHVEHR